MRWYSHLYVGEKAAKKRFAPVSYTHLDVYKRQSPERAKFTAGSTSLSVRKSLKI